MEEGEGRLGAEEWGTFEQPELKLISLIAERDAALLERNAALAEKKAACTDRDAALLHRDLAYADRDTAIMERDAAIAALEYAKSGHVNGRTDMGAKVLQILTHNSAFPLREAHQNLHPLAPTSTATVLEEPQKQIKRKEGQKDGTPKRKLGVSTAKARRPKKERKQAIGSEGDDSNLSLVVVKHEWKDHDHNDGDDGDGDDDENSGVSIDASSMPIPFCSCTGVLQQCYRWGNGGWQSACCTNNVSMYPLPINPKKKGARVPGRKMSGGAFRKLLRRLSVEGHNFPQPIDLKNHWARHGTNRYVTIK